MLTLRPTTVDDIGHVAALETMPDTREWLCETSLAWHEKALADPAQEHLLAVEGSTIVGFVVLADLHNADRVIEIRRLVVDPASRGKGHGRSLLRAAVERAYEHHRARRVWLDVKAHNHRARALYESEGFRATRTLRDAVREPDGTTSDLIVMTHAPQRS
jgi:ribosomal protein S18 acetylase RimI-like enzyme